MKQDPCPVKTFAGLSALKTLLVASLAANIILAVWMVHQTHATSPKALKSPPRPPVEAWRSAASRSNLLAEVTTNAPGKTGLPFQWSQIESDDYRQYIANLRAVGCSEATIRDIIVADVQQLFVPRLNAVRRAGKWIYWQKSEVQPLTSNQREQMVAIQKDKMTLLKELLGVGLNPQTLSDTLLFRTPRGVEKELLFLPPDRSEAALKAINEVDWEEKRAKLQSLIPDVEVDGRIFFDDQMKVLAQVLTPDELEAYRLRASPVAQILRLELRYFDCSEEEFKSLFQLRETQARLILPPSEAPLARKTAEIEAVAQLLGEERARQYECQTDFFYQNARSALEQQGLPVGPAEDTWRLARDTLQLAETVAQDQQLTVGERKRYVQRLGQETERQFKEMLGEKAAGWVGPNLQIALQTIQQKIRP